MVKFMHCRRLFLEIMISFYLLLISYMKHINSQKQKYKGSVMQMQCIAIKNIYQAVKK